MAPESAPSGLVVAVGTDRLTGLRAIRDGLAARLEDCASDQNYASLSQRLVDVLAQIADAEKAEPEKAGTALDELAKRRKVAGRPDATGATRAPRAPKRS